MKRFDLTHMITENMPVYPGTEPPRLTHANTIERDGFRETLLHMYSHTGTHMDAPAHLLAGSSTLDALDVENFVGPGAVVNCTDLGSGDKIGPEYLAGLALAQIEFVLFYTGHSALWGQADYFGPFPVPARETTERLVAAGVKGIGIDAMSIDPVGDKVLENHKILFTAGLVIVENLTGLGALVGQKFTFCALPLKFANADGAPVRAVALL